MSIKDQLDYLQNTSKDNYYEMKLFEICICAAVKTTTGKIFRGHRHRDCMDAIEKRHFIIGKEQGFITSLNRYVDREEGYRLQIEAGIKSENPNGYCQEGFLYSEDLYL